ncbi:shikimate dehydrogenase [Rhodobium orientis]|uniref:Shikimate dehydrogenase (NADP(+)) n=1 Tax=Rhodobium orientis TaxID=34017 RepID=A0A327JSP6_9HYPH|nr:shikimate dehydrogenase [Rhodobium orientis]MBK5950815.1 shikimate dehydrogenase [Rhodobium orientis]RAI29519.1 shikimate dehydrogenase [Rhodobium orientis]
MLRLPDDRSAGRGSVLIGLIGAGIAESRTPAMHEAAALAAGFSLVYRRLDLDLGPDLPLQELLELADWMGFDGLNVTYPCKQAVLPFLDELSENARAVGAVNTVVLRDGRRFGHNTDIWGFTEAFRDELPDVPRTRVLQLGAGGAGSAVAFGLLSEGVGELRLFDPDRARAELLAREMAELGKGAEIVVVEDAGEAAEGCDGVVNASPVGMQKMPGMPLPAAAIPADAWVVDVVYFPIETEFLATARARGCRVMGGGGMALWQAVRAFELFTGEKPDRRAMREAFARASRLMAGAEE